MGRFRGLGLVWRVVAAAGLLAGPAMAATDATAALASGVATFAAADYELARRQLRPVADRGSAIAETLMGVMASKGLGGAQDAGAAVGWWLRAANRGYAPAQLALAKALADGRGVRRDDGEAWIWARLASVGGASGEAGGVAGGVAGDALALAARLERGFDAARLAALEARRAAWRPWPGQ